MNQHIKTLSKDVWWKIFYILFDDDENERFMLLKNISETCNYWKDITICDSKFTYLYFYRYINKFELSSSSSPSSPCHTPQCTDSICPCCFESKKNHDYSPDSLISISTNELAQKMNEYSLFRNSDKDCLLEHVQKSHMRNLKEFQTNINNEDVDIEAILQSYNTRKALYDKIIKDDEDCTERNREPVNTNPNHAKDDDNNVIFTPDRLPVEQFEDNLNDLIQERDHLFDIKCKDVLTTDFKHIQLP